MTKINGRTAGQRLTWTILLAGVALWCPSQVIAETIRPAVIFVLDTSGSMNLPPESEQEVSSHISGADCGGNRSGTVDFCGDGFCSGGENYNTCEQDCMIFNHKDPRPGHAQVCRNAEFAMDPNGYTKLSSRLFQVKRALRNLMPELKTKVNVGLVTFKQDGYFEYVEALNPSPNAKTLTVFFPKLRLELMGAWDTANNQPPSSFTWNGTQFTLYSNSGLVNQLDSLYHNVGDPTEERRFRFANSGHSTVSGGKSWEYVGSYFTYQAKEPDITLGTGGWNDWSNCGGGNPPCVEGEGNCEDDPSDCAAGLVCADRVGRKYCDLGLWPSGVCSLDNGLHILPAGACEAPVTPVYRDQFMGPQFEENGDWFVYRRYTYGGWSTEEQGITQYNNQGEVLVTLAPAEDQASVDQRLSQFMTHIALTENGGLLALGDTPTGPALQKAYEHFRDYTEGLGEFAGQPDEWEFCRARFVILLSDGWSQGTPPEQVAADLYNYDQDNPIRTVVIALPGLTSATGLAELARIADMGDDGVQDLTPGDELNDPDYVDLLNRVLFQANNENELIEAIRDAVSVGMTGGENAANVCFEGCQNDGECESGYFCYKVDPADEYGFCLVLPPDAGPPVDAGGPDLSPPDAGVDLPPLDLAVDLADTDVAVPDLAVDLPVTPDLPLQQDGPLTDQAVGTDADAASAGDMDAQAGSDSDAPPGDGNPSVVDAEPETDAQETEAGTVLPPGPSDGGCDCGVSGQKSASPWLPLMLLCLGTLFLSHRRRR